MSFNQSFNISLNSMFNNQYALTVVSQNIANLHVDGYHRQRVDFQTNRYTTDCENVISTIRGMNGASISSLTGFIDEGAFNDVIGSNADAQYYNTLTDALKGLEDISDDLGDNGLNNLLNEFYKASARLEQFPTDVTVRREYIMSAQNVCDKFNDISKKYDALQEDKAQNVTDSVATINNLLQNLAQANKDYVTNGKSTAAQTQIDDILSQLSNYVDVTTDKNPNGSYNFYIGDIKVVQGGEVNYTLKADIDKNAADGNVVSFSLQSTKDENKILSNNITESVKSGSLKAYVDFLNGPKNKSFTSLNDMKASLNAAASAFATEVNKIQTFDEDGVFAASLKSENGELVLDRDSKEPMFLAKDGSTTITAGNIEVNDKMFENPYLVAASRIDEKNFLDEDGNLDPNWNKAIGNSDNAVEITALQNKKICSISGNGPDATLSQFLTNNAGKAGLDVANLERKADVANDILDGALTDYNNIIGVNLDEELADMIRYQRAYEASAKVFTTVNDLIGVVINMVR